MPVVRSIVPFLQLSNMGLVSNWSPVMFSSGMDLASSSEATMPALLCNRPANLCKFRTSICVASSGGLEAPA